jgi:predicted secreted acid phosphatase
MPIGATGGLATLVKATDSADQQLEKAMKSTTVINSLDIVYYQKSANGQLSKTEAFHLAKLLVKSVVPNVNKITAISLSYETMTKD